MSSMRAAVSTSIGQVGSGRPENTRAPATPAALASGNLDVAMHDHHEGAEVGVGASIGRSRVGNRVAAVVDVGDRGGARFVAAPTFSSLPLPEEVSARPDDERPQLAIMRTPFGRSV